ncbi:unnamed protein product [Acanthoscelides obtectus]|uniref:Uncharacterized protein n=1 Tax=Acanthoscelides obtectus TaxID=200917 RepID=A0A9P0KDX8_ACAOB|nr:unnamed protein product [Acanthoscelides obtectus]CAK1683145.1 Serologically defined colon cancer antigen 8 homolog [Acanthoscelides obtectus]
MFGSKKHPRSAPGYLVRPRLGAVRNLYSTRPLAAAYGILGDKRKKNKKPSSPKMDWRVRHPTYVDIAYRESVERLRVMLAESYTPSRRSMRDLDSAGEETDNQSQLSCGSRGSRFGRGYYNYLYNPITPRKYYFPSRSYTVGGATTEKTMQDQPKTEASSAPPELMSFIERQEEYIEQLEKESKFCREELATLLNKVKDVISENENLHERQKSKLIKSVFDHLETETETETETEPRKVLKSPKKSKRSTLLEGPPIVFESRISELEAQLTQAKIDLKKAQDENETLKRKINDGTILEGVGYESYRKQIDSLQKEKDALQDSVRQLQNTLSLFKDKENDTVDKVKRSLDIAEQAQYEKNAAEAEIRRLKDELERQHLKLRDAISDQSRRIADERSAAERRYTQQIEQLTAELGVQWESTNKLQLELDKQRRDNSDLRREVAQKQALIDDLKKDMQSKIINLQSDIGATGAEKSALEQQIATLQMANERTERQYKQEITRLETEVQSFRQRLDRADADLIHSRRENLRLNEQIASLQKEIALSAAISDEKSRTPRSSETIALPPPKSESHDREKELTSMIRNMESKHGMELEKTKNECDSLTVQPTKRKEPIKVDISVKVIPKPRKGGNSATTN